MFTVEFESDATVVTTLDESDKFEDVEVIMGDDMSVYMRQYEEALGEYQMIYMSYQQFLDIVSSLEVSSGLFKIEIQNNP
jgi:hypothetical protein